MMWQRRQPKKLLQSSQNIMHSTDRLRNFSELTGKEVNCHEKNTWHDLRWPFNLCSGSLILKNFLINF